MEHLFDIFYLSFLKKEDHYMEIMEHILNAIYLIILDRQHPGIQYNEAVERFENLLIRSFGDSSFDLQEAVKKTGYSTNYFRTIFSEYTGMTPSGYLEWLRIEHAKEQFRQNGNVLSIGEVANACGYQDPYYFSRVFKKREGVSPRAYMEDCLAQTGTILETPEEDSDTASFVSKSSKWHKVIS